MAIVSVAIVLSFHVKSQPSAAELAMARPLGVLFWLLSVACLLVGLGNYIGEFMRSCGHVVYWSRGMLTRCLRVSSRDGEQVQSESCYCAVWVQDTNCECSSASRITIRKRLTDTDLTDNGICVGGDYRDVCDIVGD